MEDKYSVSVIVPVYNEKDNIHDSIILINNFMRLHFMDYEILMIESGSNDGSYELCDIVAKTDSHIRIIHEGAKNGFGAALKLGHRHAAKDIVWLVTLDMPFSLDVILKAIPLLANNDAVLSYRSKDNRALGRRIQSWGYNFIIKILLGLRVKHVNSGFKIFKRDIIRNMDIVSNGWFIDAEILYNLKKNNCCYAEIPVELINRRVGASSVGRFAFFSVIKELLNFMKIQKIGVL